MVIKNMDGKFLTVTDIRAYNVAVKASNFVYSAVFSWHWFDKRTLGVQWVDATDSIAGNIAEGFGRFHKKDKQKFYYNARGSAYESLHWLHLALERELLNQKLGAEIQMCLESIPREINFQIKITEEKLKQ